MRSKTKSPNDYPILGYRVRPEIKNDINSAIDALLEDYNSTVAEGDKLYKKNEIFVNALKRGLSILRSELKIKKRKSKK